MRTHRILILILFLASFLFLFVRAITSSRSTSSPIPVSRSKSDPSIWGYIYYNTPFSLFPPNAAISLTDDNSTSFAARPAAFGPPLAVKGLSGQLWVGSGFAEDAIDGEGELGCSDLPGWGGGHPRASLKDIEAFTHSRVAAANYKPKTPKRSEADAPPDTTNKPPIGVSKLEIATNIDGTDEHLNQDSATTSSHADIQSIQEEAEIQGKVVLLMRGGCGFLEKVMWAQRRGAIAVIVGDNQKGGPLIQMFAHGEEVENVTIPSVFTARTTAHLLSSLTQPGSFIEDFLDDNGNPVLKVQQGVKVNKAKKKTDTDGAKSTKKPTKSHKVTRSASASQSNGKPQSAKTRSWLSRMLSFDQSARSVEGKSRPPSSGRLDWVMVADWNDEGDKVIRETMEKSKQKPESSKDDFVIGVEDWRDPDLVKLRSGGQKGDTPTSDKSLDEYLIHSRKKSSDINLPKGGSVVPSSGEYDPSKRPANPELNPKASSTENNWKKSRSIFSMIFGPRPSPDRKEEKTPSVEYEEEAETEETLIPKIPGPGQHDGLWVTITPTSSASPFFDTLLVLVISPLVTLTVVYALLILRARIRRRRWRAPKSVVERLPVRTYHTVAASPSPSVSSRVPSPTSTSPSTPLLQQSQSRPRPRSRTTTGVLESENFLLPGDAVAPSRSPSRNRGNEHEKNHGGFSPEWKKYMGRQVECVVCLEEYIDGVSRVMSLPCGHEFHVDCMYVFRHLDGLLPSSDSLTFS